MTNLVTAPVSVEQNKKMFRVLFILADNKVSQCRNIKGFQNAAIFAVSIQSQTIHCQVFPDEGKLSSVNKQLNATLPTTPEFSSYARHNW
jgi:hypothetical protein